MPNLEDKIASYTTGKKDVGKRNDNDKSGRQKEEKKEGIGGMVKGWFWGKS